MNNITLIIILIFFGLFLLILYLIYGIFKIKLRYQISLPCEEFPILDTPLIEPFQNPQTFNQQNAYGLLVASLNATKFSACKQIIKIPTGFEIIGYISGFDKYGDVDRNFSVIYYSSLLNMIIISFSGTIFFSEWFDDASFKQVPPLLLGSYQVGDLVHDGFYEIYITLQQRLKDILSSYNNIEPTIVFTGHSLGGALATLAFYDFLPQYPEAILYTFASPRVGNIQFSNFLMNNSQYFRIYNTEDIIPQLPPAVIARDYYQQSGKNIPFTQTLDTYREIHTQSYIDFLE
jgi:hypothetical protein